MTQAERLVVEDILCERFSLCLAGNELKVLKALLRRTIFCSGMNRDPVTGLLSVVHQHLDGSWWWYDETWTDETGPFMTKTSADADVKAYVEHCL